MKNIYLTTLEKLEKNYKYYATLTTDLRLIQNTKLYFPIYVFLTINTTKRLEIHTYIIKNAVSLLRETALHQYFVKF